MDPLRGANDPGLFITIFGMVAAAVPGFLASWKRPRLASAAVFMSVGAIVFAINSSRLSGDLVFAVVWTGAMLVAALSRLQDGLLDALSGSRIATNKTTGENDPSKGHS